MLKHNPDTLVNFATLAYGDYVRSLCRQWMSCLQHDTSMTEESADLKRVENICERLRNMVTCVLLPSRVANDVTLKLLSHVDKLFHGYENKEFTADDDFVLSSVASVLIHPSVTEIILEGFYYFPFFHWSVMDCYAPKNLSRLRSLKVLNIPESWFPKVINLPSHLQELTYSQEYYVLLPAMHIITLLQQFSNSRPSLRKIKIKSSHMDDVGLKIFLNFTQLVDLEFKSVQGFSTKGMTELLEGLAKNTDAAGTPLLRSLKCSDLTPEQIDFIVHTFHLISFYVEKPVKDIHYLSHLRSLSIHGEFSSIKSHLCAVGHQLLHLDLDCTDTVDLCVIAECCPMLVSLKVSCWEGDVLEDYFVSLPSFLNLQVVDIGSSLPKLLSCILANCTNLKILKLDCSGLDYCREFEEFRGIEALKFNIADELQENSLKHVEELQLLYSNSDVDIKILEHCQVMHRYFWQRYNDSHNIRSIHAIRLPDA